MAPPVEESVNQNAWGKMVTRKDPSGHTKQFHSTGANHLDTYKASITCSLNPRINFLI